MNKRNKNSEREQLYQPARELRSSTNADGSRVISGYAIRYNEPSADLGGFAEIIAPGAVTKTLRDNPDILCLRDHIPTLLMGRTTSKTLALTEDAQGLRFTCKLPDTTSGADLAASIDRQDLTGTSFGFRCVLDKWTADEAGNVLRTLLEIVLYEISPCSFPAYPSTSVRSCPPELRGRLKLTKRNVDGCECDCYACSGNDDCESCSDGSCDDEECAANGCPNQDGEDRSVGKSERNKMQMRLAVALRK